MDINNNPMDESVSSFGEFSNLNLKKASSMNKMLTLIDTLRNNQSNSRISLGAFDILNDLRSNNQLCDAIVKVSDGTEFPVHRAVLSATSKYFRALFTNGMSDTFNTTINIGGVDANIMKLVIDWAYTRKVVINHSNIEKLLPAADQFQVIGLLTKCIEFLEKNLSYDNCIGIRRFATIYNCPKLKESAFDFLMFNFSKVAKCSELLELNFEDFTDIILSDELNIKNESELFEISIRWIDYDKDERKQYIVKLVRCLRIRYLPKKYFVENIMNHEYLKDSEEFKEVSNEILQFYSMDDSYYKDGENFDFNDLKIRPRIPHELLFVIGGWAKKVPTNYINIYDYKACLWQEFGLTDETPIAYHGTVTIGQYIYIIGGYDQSQFHNNCKRLDIVKREWKEIAPMYTKRCYISVAYCKGYIYAMGGFDGTTRQFSAEKYNPETNQWTQIADMNHPRSDASAAELNGKIYICGGFDGAEPLRNAEFYDPNTNVWTLIENMNSPRSGLGVINYNGYIYAIGGYDGTNRLNTCEKYNHRTRKWSLVAQMYSPRSNFGIGVLDGCIYVVGGYNGTQTTKEVECYSDDKKKWSYKESIDVDTSALSVSVLKGINYVKPFSTVRNMLIDESCGQRFFFRSLVGYVNEIFK